MAAKILLPLLSLSVFYTIFYVSNVNGSNKLAQESLDAGKLPGSNAPLRTVYTGISFIDGILTILTIFFWPNAETDNPSLLVHSVAFTGTFSSAWILVSLEAWRQGNARTMVSYSVVFGLLAQVMTFAFATPLYFAIQLSTSITAVKPSAENTRIPKAILNAIPLVFLIGFILPTGLLLVPAPSTISTDLKQVFIAIWQFWPAYISILLTSIHHFFSPYTEDSRSAVHSLRWVYAVAFANTGITHIISWAIPLASVSAPWLFNEEYLEALHPFVVFRVPRPWEATVIENLANGAHSFLRWDYLIGSAGVLVWALSLYQTAHRMVYGRVENLELFAKVTILAVLVGPVGAAVELMWERDEMVSGVDKTGRIEREKNLNKS